MSKQESPCRRGNVRLRRAAFEQTCEEAHTVPMFKSATPCGHVPFLHVTYPPNSWLQHLCPELQVALTAMMTVEPLKVSDLGEESDGLICVLDRTPSPEARAAARRATSSYRLVHGTTVIACPAHNDRVFWTAEAEQAQGLAARMLSLVGFN